MPRLLGSTSGPHYHCEADRDYWQELKATFKNKPPHIGYKKIINQYNDPMWIVDKRLSSRNHIEHLTCYYPEFNRHNTSHGRFSGFRALDICSSYGISSRAFLDGHATVTVIEPEEFMAKLVLCNTRLWRQESRIHVQHTEQWQDIEYKGYDSIRLGSTHIHHLLNDYPDILTVKNIAFDYAIDRQTRTLLYNHGYDVKFNYGSIESFSKA